MFYELGGYTQALAVYRTVGSPDIIHVVKQVLGLSPFIPKPLLLSQPGACFSAKV